MSKIEKTTKITPSEEYGKKPKDHLEEEEYYEGKVNDFKKRYMAVFDKKAGIKKEEKNEKTKKPNANTKFSAELNYYIQRESFNKKDKSRED